MGIVHLGKKAVNFFLWNWNKFIFSIISCWVGIEVDSASVGGKKDFGLGTLGDLWCKAQTNLLCVSPTDAKRSVLDFHVVVDYDPTRLEEECYESKVEKRHVTARKTKRANSVVAADLHLRSSANAAAKKPRVSAAGKEAYSTTLSRSGGATYSVRKGTYVLDERNDFMFVEDEETLSPIVEKKSFASGKMKNAYKMLISGTSYAAKCFYNIGDEDGNTATKEENLAHLKEELLRQVVARQCIERFRAAARKYICNVKIMESFILTVAEGPLKGHAWLGDPLLSTDPNANCKFSGTEMAGENEDLVGKTCDAFAHFSLYDSDGAIVFVDIQGINTAALPLTSRKAETTAHGLILFDLMIHSALQSYGHGDQGWDGIGDFVQQHRCNSICAALDLPSVQDIWSKSDPDAEDDENALATGSPSCTGTLDQTSPSLDGLHSLHNNPGPEDED
ncbi:hypothetical protein EST38_g5572 [Candolleomyces aberdarensis]|uniref:Alpha-type protein kinase domain-containing protein n=1 Tax=Candolleomyces aberdarensis TaxID=2316362 RepID=A0A4V1Q3Z2_9AGAR|nr:hypothetical protein EST38_g5572 [Candolleomyces aberdarensis]